MQGGNYKVPQMERWRKKEGTTSSQFCCIEDGNKNPPATEDGQSLDMQSWEEEEKKGFPVERFVLSFDNICSIFV